MFHNHKTTNKKLLLIVEGLIMWFGKKIKNVNIYQCFKSQIRSTSLTEWQLVTFLKNFSPICPYGLFYYWIGIELFGSMVGPFG